MTTTRAAALVIGALLGPSLLLVPGLAAAVAGPASIVDWVALLALSGLLAWVFTALGRRVRTGGGVAGYVEAGLGHTAGRIVAWCFLAGVVAGAPVVCLVGGGYVAAAAGRGSGTTVLVAAVLLATVVLMAVIGARSASSSVQLALVAALVVLVALAVLGSMPAAQLVHWTPFAPHGLRSIGAAAPVLMFSFMGWEIMAAVVGGLRDVDRQLPRVVAISFTVTAVLYLALAVATIGVLGPAAAGAAPLAALLEVALGPVGGVVAAVAAVVLTLAAVNAYLTGAAEFAAELRPGTDRRVLPGVVAVVGAVVLAVVALGGLTLAALVAVPVSLLLAVYLGCTVAGVRLLTGPVRVASAVAAVATGVVMACSGPAVLGLLVVAAAVVVTGRRSPRRQPTVSPSSTTSPTSTCSARRTATLSGTR